MRKDILFVYSFYRFKKVTNKQLLIKNLLNFTKKHKIKGTLLIADEGLNGSISGYEHELNSFIKYLKNECRIRKLFIKKNKTTFIPFKKFKAKSKNEIVSLGQKNIKFTKKSIKYIKPENWKKFISKKQIKLIDVRNKYEIAIGKFKKSINPNTSTFREFPDKIKKQEIKKTDTIAMYCTGGIRCEKATALMQDFGFDEVYHLKGGILKYFEEVPAEQSKWHGECFVFDGRVAVDHALRPGSYHMCHACRMPLSDADMQSDDYQDGVSCPHCRPHLDPQRAARFAERQKQIRLAAERGEKHLGRNPRKKPVGLGNS